MKFSHLTLLAAILVGCPSKTTPPPVAAADKAATEAPKPEGTTVTGERDDGSVTGAREMPAEPEPAPELASNADFTAHITHADGTTTKGHVKRVERSEGWYGEKGWTDKAVKLTVTLEGNGTEIEAEWADIKNIAISYGSKSDIDCQFDSEYTPIMYMCVLKSTGAVTHKNGKTWTAGNRHKWRFYFDNGRIEEFWIKKLPEREQEEGTAEIGDDSTQNFALYETLQTRVLDKASSTAVTKIEINP